MMINKWLTVNKLATILAKHFNVQRVYVDNVYVDGNKMPVGMGSICNIEITLSEEPTEEEEKQTPKQRWFCERCDTTGEVDCEDDTDVYSVVHAIDDDHSLKSPECTNPLAKIRILTD